MTDVSLSGGDLVVDVQRKQVVDTIAAVDKSDVSLDGGLLIAKEFAGKLNENIKGAMGALSIATKLDPMEQEAKDSVPVSTAYQSLSEPFRDPRFTPKENERPEVEVTELPDAPKLKVEESVSLPKPIDTANEVQSTDGKEDGSTSLRPKIRPEIITKEVIPEVEKAPTTEKAIEKAVEVATEINPDLAKNPVNWIFNQNYIGLSENNAEQAPTIVGFFKNSLGTDKPVIGESVIDANLVATPKGAWCGTFVDHVLTNLGFDRLQTGDNYDRIRAARYAEFGTAVELGNAKNGDLVIKMDKVKYIDDKGKEQIKDQYHVGFYVGTFKGISTANKEEVTSIQQALTDKGFDPKGVDGGFGPNTIAALNEFQKANGLEVTSKVTGELFKTLTGEEGTVVDTVLLLGGNQDNEVNVTAYAVGSVTNVRRIGDLNKVDKDIITSITKDISFGKSTR